jgi:hypothetical protein
MERRKGGEGEREEVEGNLGEPLRCNLLNFTGKRLIYTFYNL